MRVTGSRAFARPAPTPTMPPGLVELMEGLAKDVLKNNPENVYEFCAGHMQKLLEIRDGPGPPRQQLSLEQKIAKAQHKLRQRITNRNIQRDVNTSENSNANQGLEDKPTVVPKVPIETAIQPPVEIPNGNTSVMQPVINAAFENTSEKKTDFQSVVKTAIPNASTIESNEEIDTKNTSAIVHGEKLVNANEVEIFHEPDVTLTDGDASVGEAHYPGNGNTAQSNETSQVSQKSGDPTKEAIEDINEEKAIEKVDVNSKHISDKVFAESDDVAKAHEQSKNDVEPNAGDIEHTDDTLQIVLNNEVKVNKSESSVNKIRNNKDITESENITKTCEQSKNDVEPNAANNEQTDNTPQVVDNIEAQFNKSESSDNKMLNNEDFTESENVRKAREQSKNDVEPNAANIEQTDNIPQILDNIEAQFNKSESSVNEMLNNEDFTESENVRKAREQSKNDVELNAANSKHIDNTPQFVDNNEALFNNSESSVNEIQNNNEEKVINISSEVPEKGVTRDKLNEVISTTAFSSDSKRFHIDDTNTMEVKEETIVIKKELTDIQHDEILKEKYANIESAESRKGVHVEGEIIKKEEFTNNRLEFLLETREDNIENKQTVESIVHASKESVVKQEDKLLPRAEVPSVRELSTKELETAHQTEAVSAENSIVDFIDTEEPVLLNPHVSETGLGLKENHVITVEMTEKANVESLKHDDVGGHDVRDNQVYVESKVNKELKDSIQKLPEQEHAYREELIVKDTEDDTTKLNKTDTIIESDETQESTAVSGMDLETAAITIQKVFRTFLFSKSRASTLDETVNENSLDEDMEKKGEPEYILTSSNLNKERRALGISRMDTVLQTVNEEKSLSLSDDSSLSSAATIIQAHVRGFLVRNKLPSNKTASSSSLANSDGQSTLSLDGDTNEHKKTILNIHIVPERGQFMSRDESLLTSIDLPLDNSPPSSINLHPLGYDKSAERRKQLKREDAVQSISPPSNNSGKLSEEVDSVKDALHDSADVDVKQEHESVSVNGHDKPQDADTESCDTTLTISSTAETIVDADTYNPREVLTSPDHNTENATHDVITNSSSDEMDVVSPYPTIAEKNAKVASEESEDGKPKLVHSGEFHDLVIQTQVKRSESSVVREFKNVLVYFLLWDKT